MSEILEMLTRVQTALDRPTVRLLDGRKWAPVTLAVFHATFDNERRSVAVETLHGNVDSYLHELRLAGVETGSSRFSGVWPVHGVGHAARVRAMWVRIRRS